MRRVEQPHFETLDLNGEVLGTLSSFGKTQGKLDFAHHLTVDDEGSIYVVEIKNWRAAEVCQAMKWITREKVKVDRVACPWLIKKFIDPKAEFIFSAG